MPSREETLEVFAGLPESTGQNKRDVEAIKKKYPDLPPEVLEYFSKSIEAIDLFVSVVIQYGKRNMEIEDELKKIKKKLIGE